METNPTFKQLKITNSHGIVNYIPNNKTNFNHHETHKRALSKEKRDKYLIEEVELSVEQAAEIGIAEAYNILNPPAKKAAQQAAGNNDSIIKMLMEQNQLLMERLAVIESKSTAKK
jgi:antitoxin component HigA of HigAB toxin-antitoxin module